MEYRDSLITALKQGGASPKVLTEANTVIRTARKLIAMKGMLTTEAQVDLLAKIAPLVAALDAYNRR